VRTDRQSFAESDKAALTKPVDQHSEINRFVAPPTSWWLKVYLVRMYVGVKEIGKQPADEILRDRRRVGRRRSWPDVADLVHGERIWTTYRWPWQKV